MEIVFKSFDGKFFKTKAECEKHEGEVLASEQNVKLIAAIQKHINELNSMLEVYKANTGLRPGFSVDQGRILLHFLGRK